MHDLRPANRGLPYTRVRKRSAVLVALHTLKHRSMCARGFRIYSILLSKGGVDGGVQRIPHVDSLKRSMICTVDVISSSDASSFQPAQCMWSVLHSVSSSTNTCVSKLDPMVETRSSRMPAIRMLAVRRGIRRRDERGRNTKGRDTLSRYHCRAF